MRKIHTRPAMNRLRFAACISAIFLGFAGASARAKGSATVDLARAEFGKGLDVHLDSGTTLLPPAASYTYSLTATVHVTGILALIFPAPVDLSTFLDTIQPGSSSALNGTYLNPNGTLPLKLIKQTFAGSVTLPGGQVATGSVRIVGKITATGQLRFDVTNADFSITNFHLDIGKVVFDSGSLTVTAPSTIELKSTQITAVEGAMAKVIVKRRVSDADVVSVHYESLPGTADGVDYTPVSGDLAFGDGETTKFFEVPITKRDGAQGNRNFKVKLSAPTGGASLGVNRKAIEQITDAP